MEGVLISGLEWTFDWRRRLFVWEEQLLCDLRENLVGVRLGAEEDGWRWRLEDEGYFTVKSAYEKLEGLVLNDDLWSDEERVVFAQVWNSPAPLKVVAFSWKLLLDRIPTRENLAVRSALPLEVSTLCVLCGNGVETSNHFSSLHGCVESLDGSLKLVGLQFNNSTQSVYSLSVLEWVGEE